MSENLQKLPALVRFLPGFIKRRIECRPNLVKILDNIGWLFFDKILRMGVGLIVGVWVARYLGPEQFGLFNFATAFVGMFGAIAGLGLQGVVVRDLVREPSSREEILGSAAVLQLIGGLVAYAFVLATIFWLRPDDALAKTIVAILGSMMLFKASEVAVCWFESQVLSKFTVWVQNGTFLVFASVKVVLILKGAPLVAFAWVSMAEGLVVAMVMVIVLGLRGPRARQLRATVARAKSLIADSWPLLLSGVAVMIYMRIDQIMLGQMVGDEAVGIYSAAVRISEMWYFIPMTVTASVFPAVLEAKSRSNLEYLKKLQLLYELTLYASMIIALPLWIAVDQIIEILFGLKYASASDILSIYIWNTIFVAWGVARGKWMIAEGLQKFSLVYIGVSLLVNIMLNCVLIPGHKGVGAAYATVISTLVATLVAPAFLSKTRISSLMLIRSVCPAQIFSYLKQKR